MDVDAPAGLRVGDDASEDPIDALAVANPAAAIQALRTIGLSLFCLCVFFAVFPSGLTLPPASEKLVAGQDSKIRKKENAVLKLGLLLAKQGLSAGACKCACVCVRILLEND